MSAFLHEDQPLKIVFGIREGDDIRFKVLGRTCPDANTDWYRSQLDAEIHINVRMFLCSMEELRIGSGVSQWTAPRSMH
jgi:hypothetical protein